MVREVVRKRRQNDGAGSKKAAADPIIDDAIQNKGVGSSNTLNDDQDEEEKIQSSTGKALSTRQTRKVQSRASLQAPYANLLSITPGKNNSTFNSPRTPLRTPRSATTKRQDLWDLASPTSPNSPSMRALNAIVSFISPYASARRSAAFGEPEEEQDRSAIWKGKQKQDSTALVEEDEDENDEEDIASSLYPPLPSDPNSSLQAITKDDMENDTTIIEQTIDQIEENDEDESEEGEGEGEDANEQEQAITQTQIEDDEQSQPSETDVVFIEEDVEIVPPPKADVLQEKPASRSFSISSTTRPEPTFGAPSAIGLSVSESQTTQNLGESTNVSNSLPLPAARSPFQSNGFVAPRESTPSKMGFGAIATEPVNSAFKPVRQPEDQQPSVVPPSSAFTFGMNQEASTSRLPQYPRAIRPTKTISPLAKNYELLSRFFAEKAEQEARAEASASISSMDEDGNEQSGALTEIELAGCMRLIEQSYAQGQGEEVERLRHEALRRGQAPQIQDEDSRDNRMDEDEVHFANSHIENSRRQFISRSPSLPLGAAAGEGPVPGLYGYRSRPSSSFLAPTYRDAQDARVNQSLANIFGNSATAPPKRKHRPLYLGPGVGATATSAILRRTQQMQARKSALTTQRASLREQLRPLPVRAPGRSGVAEEEDDSEGPRKRRKLPEEPVQSNQATAPALIDKSTNQKSTEQASVQTTDKTPPSRTATADAMLSILSSGPSIPSRSPAGTNTIRASTVGASEAGSPSNPELINPYETRSRLRTRSTAPTSTAAAKEKERLKEEREKRLKAQKEREARKESTLDFIKRTAPTPPARRGRQIRLEEDDDDDEDDDEEEEAERESEKAAAAEAEAKEKAKVAEENKKRKNEELKRRMEKLNKDAKSKDSTSDGTEPKSSTQPASSIPVSKSFSFNSGFAPKKPSPLSQAASNHVPDSPSASSESSERSTARAFASPQNVKAGPPVSSTIVIDEDDEEAEVVEAPKPKAPLFNFGNANSTSASKGVSAPTPTFNFSTKAPESTSGSTSQPSTSAPFSFGKPVEKQASKESAVPSNSLSATAKTTSDRDEAASAPVSSLPKFDFTLDVVLPESSDKKDESARKSVNSESVESLPKFDFGGSTTAESSAPTETNKTFSFSVPKPAATSSTPSAPAFSFKPIPSAAAAVSPVGKETSETSAEPGSGATSGDDSASASDKTKSALLSGTGEGEEDENSLHEVRCKIWNLSDGKWNDLGIGALKIKKHKTTSKQRVLVRNEGNGKVTVNFNIMSTFKPTQDKNVVTFLGFDQTGKPTNYRCKIKTEGDAKDLKEALEKSAKEAA